jgi:L-amino acid N-acyltransferase YncA
MHIRHASPEDLPRIVDIYNASIPGRLATADTLPVTLESRREWFANHSLQKHPLWVLEQGGEILAWVGLQPFFKTRPAYHATAEISVYVDSQAHRRGLASVLISHALTACPELGITSVTALIFGHNDPSLKVFTRAGFQPWGHLPGIAELDGNPADLVILGLRLHS